MVDDKDKLNNKDADNKGLEGSGFAERFEEFNPNGNVQPPKTVQKPVEKPVPNTDQNTMPKPRPKLDNQRNNQYDGVPTRGIMSSTQAEKLPDEFKDMFFEKPGEPDSPPQRDSGAKMKFSTTMLSLAIAIGFGIGVFYAYNSGQGETDEIVPMVQSDVVLKEKPLDPQGMEIKHLDKVVYGVVSDNSMIDERIERLLPTLEKPVVIKSKKPAKKKKINADTTEIVVLGNGATLEDVKLKPVIKSKRIKKPKRAKTAKVINGKDSVNIMNSWRVQLASVGSKKQAQIAFRKQVVKFSALKNAKLNIQKAVINAKTYYRVQAIGFANKATAIKACNSIKFSGGQCLVKQP